MSKDTKDTKKEAAAAKAADRSEMFLESPSGFMMPFLTEDDEEVEVSLGYGEQVHPNTREKFFHHGMDFVCDHRPLLAVATGTVVGVGQDAVHDAYVIIRYGKFEVKYGHVSQVFVRYGNKVDAGRQVAVSGDFLHLGVTFKGRDLNPEELLAILFTNVAQLAALGIKGQPKLVDYDIPVRNGYEQDQEHIIDMMMRYLPEYFQSLQQGSYRPVERTESSLRRLFEQAAERNYLFEHLPTMGNPLGLGPQSAPLVGQVQQLIISDFLAYMASRHREFVPTWSDEQKKTFWQKYLPPR